MMYEKEIIAHKKAITFVSGFIIVVATAAKVLFHQMTVYDCGMSLTSILVRHQLRFKHIKQRR